MAHTVHVINPPPKGSKKTRRKKTAKRTTSKRTDTVAKKKTTRRRKTTTRRRRRKSNPSTTTAVARRRPRRRATPTRRRRRNPSTRSMGGAFMGEVNKWLPAFAGKLFVAFAVRKVGTLGGGQLMGGAPIISPTAGQSWGLGQYVVAALATHFGSRLFKRVLNPSEFRRGGYDLILTKLVWTEGIARSDWAKAQFGNLGPSYSPATGQTWLSTPSGRSVAMQGELVAASPLDGELVEASPLDNTHSASGGRAMTSYRESEDPYVTQYR